MPAKKLSSLKSFSINSTGSRGINSDHVRDLITKSEAALSSQASVYQTQRTNLSQQTIYTIQPDQMQFNRQQIGQQVFITKQQQSVIQQILQISRKGKINSKNAFEIPLKVITTQSQQSVGNKFWKFASQLLNASMSIYDKRVENMYLSTNTMQSKLTRININIKEKNQKSYQDTDDVIENQERKRNQQLKQRQELLNISIHTDMFQGKWDTIEQGYGYSTLEHKSKIDIKRIQDKFIADPMFNRTQKMFDSYSLKSLMLNIFSINQDLQVQIFNKKSVQNQQQQVNNKKIQNKSQSTQKLQVQEQNHQHQHQPQQKQQQQQQTISQKSNHYSTIQGPISQNLQHLITHNKFILDQNGLFQSINKWISQQPQLKTDLLNRKGGQLLQNNDAEQIIQKQRQQIKQIFKQFDSNFDQNNAGHNFNQLLQDRGLYEASESQSQPFHNYQFNNNNQESYHNSLSLNNYQSQVNSAPLSYQASFFEFDQIQGNYDPIMPWEIQFKDNKLRKKKRTKQTRQKRGQKSKSKNKNNGFQIDFTINRNTEKRQDILKSKQVKSKFIKLNQINRKNKYKDINLIPKQMQTVYNEYHQNKSHRFRDQNSLQNSMKLRQSQKLKLHDNSNQFNFDDNNANFFQSYKKPFNHQDQQTRIFQPQNNFTSYHSQQILIPSLDNMSLFHNQSHQNFPSNYFHNNSQFIGRGMGINNIRQIKKFIYNQIKDKGLITISMVNKMLCLSPAQIFTIFLHLVNQHNLVIESNYGEMEICLKINNNKVDLTKEIEEGEI